jgi:hypothetical protein
MIDRALLEELIAKLREMEEQLSMAQLEATQQSLLASRIRHLTVLAFYVRTHLEKAKEPADLPMKADDPNSDSQSRA